MTADARTGETRVRALIERRARAIRERDLDGATAAYVPDVQVFDALPPLRYRGRKETRARSEAWLSAYEGPIGYEIRDLEVAAAGGAAFAHYLYRVTGTTKDGAEVDMWVRATLGLRRVDDEWRIAHEHHSVPFDGETGEAALDLEP